MLRLLWDLVRAAVIMLLVLSFVVACAMGKPEDTFNYAAMFVTDIYKQIAWKLYSI